MSAYGLSGYLVKAHHLHLMREAAMARRAQQSPGSGQSSLPVVHRLRVLVFSLK